MRPLEARSFDIRHQSVSVPRAWRRSFGASRTQQIRELPQIHLAPRAFAATVRLHMSSANEPLIIAGREFQSRLLLGTGKFSVQRGDGRRAGGERHGDRDGGAAAGRSLRQGAILSRISSISSIRKYLLLPNTSGANNAEEAVRLARLARGGGRAEVGEAGDPSRTRATCCRTRSRR